MRQKYIFVNSGIARDPNRPDQPDYIARLLCRIVTVSVETAKLVAALPGMEAEENA